MLERKKGGVTWDHSLLYSRGHRTLARGAHPQGWAFLPEKPLFILEDTVKDPVAFLPLPPWELQWEKLPVILIAGPAVPLKALWEAADNSFMPCSQRELSRYWMDEWGWGSDHRPWETARGPSGACLARARQTHTSSFHKVWDFLMTLVHPISGTANYWIRVASVESWKQEKYISAVAQVY